MSEAIGVIIGIVVMQILIIFWMFMFTRQDIRFLRNDVERLQDSVRRMQNDITEVKWRK